MHSLTFSAANDDYIPVQNSQLTFNQATNTDGVQVFIVNDFLLEPRETIEGFLTLETVNVNVEIRPDVAQVEIVDDDSKFVDVFLSVCLFVTVCLSVCLSACLSLHSVLSVTDNYFTDCTPVSPRCDYWVQPRCLHGARGCRLSKCHN